MIFTVLSYIDLEPVIELDDYISAIWNNKYFTAGEFEIVLRTTPERRQKVIRNNFIILNGTDEIAIIDFVQFSKDEDNGATMTVKGSFAQGLLKRRIIWDKTILRGNIDYQIQELLKDNAIEPKDKDRYLATDADKKIAYQGGYWLGSQYLQIPSDFEELAELQLTSDIQISTEGKADAYGIYSPRYILEQCYSNIKMTGVSEIQFRAKNTNGFYELYENPLEDGVKTTFNIGEKGCFFTGKTNKQPLTVSTSSQPAFIPAEDETYFINNAKITEGTNGAIVTYSLATEGVKLADQVPFSNRVKGISKKEYKNEAFGVSIFDNQLNMRFYWNKALIDYATTLYDEYLGTLGDDEEPTLTKWNFCFRLYFGFLQNSTYNVFNSTDYLIYTYKEYEKVDVDIAKYNNGSYTTISFDEFKALFTAGKVIAPYTTIYPNSTKLDIIYRTKGQNHRNYIALGTRPNAKDKIELQLQGDNLLDKVEELLTLYGLGLKARFDKASKIIYLDIYQGVNRSSNIIFSEDLDNLISYDIGLSSSKPNVALVYSKTEETKDIITIVKEYNETAGASAGINRTELYVNRTGEAGYIGPDYTQQLIEDGKLSLQQVTLAIENEIDPYSSVYRTQFNLGDIVRVIIKDLDITYDTRVLEVREYNDENGYTIDLVLGE